MPRGKINYLDRKDSPCKVCGGILFYPLQNSCVRCVRKKNGDKIAASFNNGKVDRMPRIDSKKECEFMQGVCYD